MQTLAPAAIAFVTSPEYLMPPSAMIAMPRSFAARYASAIAVICGMPAPVTIRVVQIDPGPIPTFTASAPASISAIAIEYGSYGIRCNCVCPDIIDTPLARTDRDNWDAMTEALPARYPVGRIGQAEDVAEAIAFAAPGASWMSGVILNVDGGFSAKA